MMELIDHDDVEVVGRNSFDAVGSERLHTGEDVLPTFRPRTCDVEFPEGSARESFSVYTQRLLQDFLSVSDEEQSQVVAPLPTESAIIQSRDNCLTRTGRGHHEIAVAVVQLAL